MTIISHPDRLAAKLDLAGRLAGYGAPNSTGPQVENVHPLQWSRVHALQPRRRPRRDRGPQRCRFLCNICLEGCHRIIDVNGAQPTGHDLSPISRSTSRSSSWLVNPVGRPWCTKAPWLSAPPRTPSRRGRSRFPRSSLRAVIEYRTLACWRPAQRGPSGWSCSEGPDQVGFAPCRAAVSTSKRAINTPGVPCGEYEQTYTVTDRDARLYRRDPAMSFGFIASDDRRKLLIRRYIRLLNIRRPPRNPFTHPFALWYIPPGSQHIGVHCPMRLDSSRDRGVQVLLRQARAELQGRRHRHRRARTAAARATSPTPSTGCSGSRAPRACAATPWRTSSSAAARRASPWHGRGQPQGPGLNSNSPDGQPECVVTRRLYRNGETEYLMNGHVCRLRDIHELFMDTGSAARPTRSSSRARSASSSPANPPTAARSSKRRRASRSTRRAAARPSSSWTPPSRTCCA